MTRDQAFASISASGLKASQLIEAMQRSMSAFSWSLAQLIDGLVTGQLPTAEMRIEGDAAAKQAASDLRKLADACEAVMLAIDRGATILGAPLQ